MTPNLPRFQRILQTYPPSRPIDLVPLLTSQLTPLLNTLQPGHKIALATGSRGITRIDSILITLCRLLQNAGASPFIIPAMGSHGGATPEGQAALLAEYGITQESTGAPILNSMETTLLGQTPEGFDVHCATTALSADGILLVNRVKPHTDFQATLGSGLLKMAAIGLGKRNGATACHQAAARHGYEPVLRSVANTLLQKTPILGGLAIIEDQRHQPHTLEFVPASHLPQREATLLDLARNLMPRLPLDEIDLLIVDRIGKNISGAGVDPNIINRSVHGYTSELARLGRSSPFIRRILVRDLTPETKGNAIGIGFADITTNRLARKLDPASTFVNALTAMTPNGAKLPIHFETDLECINAALQSTGVTPPDQARVVHIADSLSLEQIAVSLPCLPELRQNTAIQLSGIPYALEFDTTGHLLSTPGPAPTQR